MMRVTVDVNGDPITVVDVQNLGPTGPLEEHPGGERVYRWQVTDGRHVGLVGLLYHRRADGAHVLAARVLEQIHDD